jgi:hypothetical protein
MASSFEKVEILCCRIGCGSLDCLVVSSPARLIQSKDFDLIRRETLPNINGKHAIQASEMFQLGLWPWFPNYFFFSFHAMHKVGIAISCLNRDTHRAVM